MAGMHRGGGGYNRTDILSDAFAIFGFLYLIEFLLLC